MRLARDVRETAESLEPYSRNGADLLQDLNRAHKGDKVAEGRVLVTRDKELAARVPGSVPVRSDVLEEQIREVASRLSLRLVEPLSRCSLCNERLVQVPVDAVDGLVPEGVRSRHHEFWTCPSCRRVYWQGSHWDKMVERLDHLDLPRADGP